MSFAQHRLKGQEAAGAQQSLLDPTRMAQAAWPYPTLLSAPSSLLHCEVEKQTVMGTCQQQSFHQALAFQISSGKSQVRDYYKLDESIPVVGQGS